MGIRKATSKVFSLCMLSLVGITILEMTAKDETKSANNVPDHNFLFCLKYNGI